MNMKLDLTEEQYELLLNLVFSEFDKLDRQEDSLLVCADFCDETDEFKTQLEELQKPLETAKELYKKVAVYKMPWLK